MRDITYEIKGLVPESVVVSVQADLRISEDIDHEVDTAAATYGYYAVLAEKAETRYQKMKFSYEQWRAQTESRQAMIRVQESKKSLTESQMKAYVHTQPKYGAYQARLIEYDEHRRVLKILARAFELKKDLVQSKSANRRSEVRK